MPNDLTITDVAKSLDRVSRSSSVLEVIARAAADPSVDIDKLERLLAMQERVLDQDRKAIFNEALSRAQARMPQLDQHGRIDYNKPGVKPIPYALLEDIDKVIRPIYIEEGFAVAWNTEQAPDGTIRVIGDFKHRCGHTEQRAVTMPADSSGAK